MAPKTAKKLRFKSSKMKPKIDGAKIYKSYRKSKSAWQLSKGPFNRIVSSDPFEQRKFCKFTYRETFTLNVGTSGIFGSQVKMSLNSIYDPNSSGVGHQPYGHDTMALIYTSYKVFGCLVKLIITDPSEDGLVLAARIVPPNVSADLTGGYHDATLETTMTTSKHINNTGKQITHIKQYVPISQAVGVTELQFKAAVGSPYSAYFGANPTDQAFLLFAAANARGASTGSVVVSAEMTYYTQCYGRQKQNTS